MIPLFTISFTSFSSSNWPPRSRGTLCRATRRPRSSTREGGTVLRAATIAVMGGPRSTMRITITTSPAAVMAPTARPTDTGTGTAAATAQPTSNPTGPANVSTSCFNVLGVRIHIMWGHWLGFLWDLSVLGWLWGCTCRVMSSFFKVMKSFVHNIVMWYDNIICDNVS